MAKKKSSNGAQFIQPVTSIHRSLSSNDLEDASSTMTSSKNKKNQSIITDQLINVQQDTGTFVPSETAPAVLAHDHVTNEFACLPIQPELLKRDSFYKNRKGI